LFVAASGFDSSGGFRCIPPLGNVRIDGKKLHTAAAFQPAARFHSLIRKFFNTATESANCAIAIGLCEIIFLQ